MITILNICAIFILINTRFIHTTDHIVINGPKLSLEVRTTSSSSIINGITNNYIKLDNKDEELTITCSKVSRILTGTLYSFVNTESAKKTNCLEYDYNPLHSDDDPKFCLKQQFTFKIESSSANSYYEVLCRFVETADYLDSVSLTLYKLYDDGLPRIRSGLDLDSVNGVVEHSVNKERLSCEAIKYSNQTNRFNALQWLTADMNKTIGFNTHSSQIANSLFNYTSLFPTQSPLIHNNSIYKCCTILNGIIQQCQQFLANMELESEPIQVQIRTQTTSQSSTTTTFSLTINESITTTTKTSSSTTLSKNSKGAIKPFFLEKNIKVISSSNGSLFTVSERDRLGNAEVGIIIACTGGVVILSLVLILGMLCYKRHRYGAIYLSKNQTSSSQETISELKSTSSNEMKPQQNEKSFKVTKVKELPCPCAEECVVETSKKVSDCPCDEDFMPKKKGSKNHSHDFNPPPAPPPLPSTSSFSTSANAVRPISNKKKPIVDDLDYLNDVKLVRHESLYSKMDETKKESTQLDINSSNKKIEQKIKTKETKKLTQRLLEPCPPCVEAGILNAPAPPPPPPPLENIAEAIRVDDEYKMSDSSLMYASQPIQVFKGDNNGTMSSSSFPPPPSSIYSFVHEDTHPALTTIRVVNKTDEDNNQITVLY